MEQWSVMLVAVVVVLVTLVPRTQSEGCMSSSGTNPRLGEIFIGRCWQYQTISHPTIFSSNDTCQFKNCTRLFELFRGAIEYREPCNASYSGFQQMVEEAVVPIPRNKSLFWSGTNDLVHHYSALGSRFFTLEDWLPGFLLNNLNFCGTTSGPGLNYIQCTRCSSENFRTNSFWSAASIRFAQEASGVITVLLTGSSDRPAFRNDSFFASLELPNLNVSRVDKVITLVIHEIDGACKEKCGEGSLVELENSVRDRGLEYECLDDPRVLLYILCEENPEAKECMSMKAIRSSCQKPASSPATTSTTLPTPRLSGALLSAHVSTPLLLVLTSMVLPILH